MSSMGYDAGGPPAQITIPGDPGAAAGPGGPPDAGGGSGDPEELVNKAKDLLRQALDLEPDHEDKLLIEKMLTEAQQYLATQQKVGDQAMGAGPGVKAVRKALGS